MIPNTTWRVGSMMYWKKLIIKTRRPSMQMIWYAIIQMITRIFFSWWEHKKLQNSSFREHVNFGDGFKEKVTLIATMPVSRFKFLNTKQISNNHKRGHVWKIFLCNFL
jgi:hypothetical protein